MDRMYSHAAPQAPWTESETPAHRSPAATPALRPTPAPRPTHERRRQILTHAVELDVIPELLARYRVSAPVDQAIAAADVTNLTSLVLEHDGPGALAFVMAMHGKGASAESLLLELLAPAARALGDLWEDDLCDFTQVTIGLWRLQSVLRALAPSGLPLARTAPRIALVPLPGDPHTFGLDMVHTFFCGAGWNAWTGTIESSAELRQLVEARSFDVLGFSLACDERLDDVRREIASVRRASCNQSIAVIVGGPGFTANPSLAAAVGADATAHDARDAVTQAAALLSGRHRASTPA